MESGSTASKVNSKLSRDLLANIFTLVLLITVGVYFFLTRGFHHADLSRFGIIVVVLLLQIGSHFIPKLKDVKTLNSGGAGALLIYNVVVGLLFLWFIPLFSPFVFIWAAVMFITIYYRGMVGYLISLTSLISLVILVSLRNGVPPVEFGQYLPYITIVLGAAYGGIIQRISAIDNEVRSEYERVSNRVELSNKQLNSLISNMSDAVVATDHQGKVLFYNFVATKLLNTTADLAGENFHELLDIADKSGQRFDVLATARTQNRDLEFDDLHFISHNNEQINLFIDISPIRSNYNQQQGFIIILRDITKQKSLDAQYDEFIALTSHELRTPLAVVEGNISFVLHDDTTRQLDPVLQNRLKAAHESIVFLSDLVNDFDLLAEVERKNLHYKVEQINPTEITHQLMQTYRKKAVEKGLEIKLELDESLPEITTSQMYLREILQNFLTNAIKYTDSGSIKLKVQKAGERELLFSVADSGVGIGQSDKEKLFHKFYRVEDYRTRQTRGTGLGLYISLKLAQQLHGKIWFESELNHGSTFYVQLPSLIHK